MREIITAIIVLGGLWFIGIADTNTLRLALCLTWLWAVTVTCILMERIRKDEGQARFSPH